MKRALLVAAVVAVAGSPWLAANAMPRAATHAPAVSSDNAAALAHSDHGLAWRHMARLVRDRDDSNLRRFRNAFD